MWFKKKRPIVQIFDDCIRDTGDVDVQDYRKAAIENPVKTHYGNWASKLKEKDPPPDTIESLINRLIELGEPKPEVVITGEVMAIGHSYWTVDIDRERIGQLIGRGQGKLNWFDTLEEAEKSAKDALKFRLSRIVTETTTITY